MKILFLVYHGFSDTSGITKKIKAQVEGLRQNGHEVHVCTYIVREDGHRCRMIDDEVLQDFGTGRLAQLRKRCCYGRLAKWCKENGIEAVYARSFHNANPFSINFFRSLRKAGIPSVLEIPTYPYDQEYVGFGRTQRWELKVDKIFRHKLARQMVGIVTFASVDTIFGQRSIRISNGISFEDIPLRKPIKAANSCNTRPKETLGTAPTDTINLIGVAEVHYWHGYDRLIAGLGEYYKNGGLRHVVFHIIGGIGPSEMEDSQHAPGFRQLIERYKIAEHVRFHGAMYGDELNGHFDSSQFAIGSLARHRSGISDIKTLKNREYAARGIPFIYSENDSDFEHMPYVMKALADESPIDIQGIINFVDNHDFQPESLRSSIETLSWRHQMATVVEAIKNG